MTGARRGEQEQGEWTYVRKGGAALTVELVVTALRGVEGAVTGFLFVAADVSERNRGRERLRLTMEAARIGTWDWDLAADRCSWSENVPAILGRDVPQTGGFAEFLALLLRRISRAFARGDRVGVGVPARHDVYETEFRVSDRRRGCAAGGQGPGLPRRGGRAAPGDGHGDGGDGAAAAAEALLQALGAAESANEAKTSFLTSISHDIRTPLAGIIGLVEIMQQSEWAAGDQQREQAHAVGGGRDAAGADQQLADLEDRVGQAGAGGDPVRPARLVRDVAGALSPAAAAKRLRLNVALADGRAGARGRRPRPAAAGADEPAR